jgi:hypothetical protein
VVQFRVIIVSNKGTLHGFFLKLCSIFFINMEKLFTIESLKKIIVYLFLVHASSGIILSKELEVHLFIK